MYVTHGPRKIHVYYIQYMWIYTIFVCDSWAPQDIRVLYRMYINCKHDSQSQYMYVTHGPRKRYVYYIGYMWIYTIFACKTWASQDIYVYKIYVYYIGCMWTHGVPQDMCVLNIWVYYMYVCITYVYHIGCMQTHRVPQSMCVLHICVCMI